MGAALARASEFNRICDYAESKKPRRTALDEITTTDGADGIFIGSGDLVADRADLSKPGDAEV
jgi:4-hydroxy-2-oxoheptanedioate aldolase